MRPDCERELREQILQEIENKVKPCCNPTYKCTIPRIEGYDYCVRHILKDPRANYRQCGFTYPNGRRCPNALRRADDTKKDPNLTTLCFEHSRQAQLQKTRINVGRLCYDDSNETLLHSLAHHLIVEEARTVGARAPTCEQEEEIDVVSPHVAPFVSHDQIHGLATVVATIKKRRRVLDYASDSSVEEESPSLLNTSCGIECNESDDESIDSQDEDLLKHAGIYTRQETVRISEGKLTKLQGLYIDQINRLHHTLRERRRRYLNAIRKEREMLCSIHDQFKESTRERKLYEQLKALNTYHHRHGSEAVLYKKFKEKRSRVAEAAHSHKSGPGFTKCIFTEGGVKCGDRSLPCCKFCRKHILEDKKQKLFRACQVEKSGVVCQEPMPCIFDDSTCVLHLVIPAPRMYNQKKYESETEEEDIEIKKEILEPTQSRADEADPKVEQLDLAEAANSESGGNVTISHDIERPGGHSAVIA